MGLQPMRLRMHGQDARATCLLLRTLYLALFSLAGLSCQNAGVGGTGEIVVPRSQLREIQETSMQALSSTRPTTSPTTLRISQPPLAEIKLSIEDARRLALANNLDLRVELFNPAIAQEGLSEQQAAFESVFTTRAQYGTFDRSTGTRLEGSQSNSLNVTPGVRVPLRTGGELSFDAPLGRNETDNEFATLNPAYTSDVNASISHPLLRNAGLFVSTQGIRVAFYGYQQSQARTKLEIIRILAEVDRVYWRLYAARRALDVRKKEYDLADAQLGRARRQVEAQALAEVEIVRAESGVADRLEQIIIAENDLRQRQREMKRVLNEAGLEMDSGTIIVPASEPNPVFFQLNPDTLMQTALRQRMDMLEQELQIAREESNVAVARNGLLPLVSLNYTYGINGLGRAFDDAFSQIHERDFEDHTVGVQIEVPIGNEAARSSLRQSLSRRLQAIATKEQRALTIRQEVLDATDQLEANWQRILAAQKRVILNARLLDAEVRQFGLGLRTSTEVLDAQAKLAAAQLDEISALVEYQIAQVDIAFATGTLLGASRVTWAPAPLWADRPATRPAD